MLSRNSVLQEKGFAVSKFGAAEKEVCCLAYGPARKTGRAKNFFCFAYNAAGRKAERNKLTRIKVNQSVGADQGRADFSPVNSLVGADQGRARIYFSYRPS